MKMHSLVASKTVVGLRLKAARKALKMSQEDMAELLGVHRNTVANWEGGVHYPPLPLLQSICLAYGLRQGQLLHRTDPDGIDLGA